MNLYKSTLTTSTRIYQHTSNVITCTRYVRTKERPKKDFVLIFNHLLHLRYFFLFCGKHFTALHMILAAFFPLNTEIIIITNLCIASRWMGIFASTCTLYCTSSGGHRRWQMPHRAVWWGGRNASIASVKSNFAQKYSKSKNLKFKLLGICPFFCDFTGGLQKRSHSKMDKCPKMWTSIFWFGIYCEIVLAFLPPSQLLRKILESTRPTGLETKKLDFCYFCESTFSKWAATFRTFASGGSIALYNVYKKN